MAVVAVCGVLLLAGLAAAVGWGGRPFAAPPVEPAPSAAEVARRFVWYAAMMLLAGVTVGILVIGAGGRLAMRLLAVTAGEAAQGRITEADEVVGRISVDGTIGFVVFNGVFGGIVGGALYLLLRRYLPGGRRGGIVFGLGLLVVLGTTLDPLRSENPDFDIVGPGWLAVVVFTLLALLFGAAMAAIANRASAWLPLPARNRKVLLRYLPPAALAAVGFTATVVLVVVGAVVVAASRWQLIVDAVRSRRALLAGRLIAALLVVLALPNAIRNVADIAGR